MDNLDLGSYDLNSKYSYTAPDPTKSKFKGLMNTDYDQLRTDLATPGNTQINQVYDRADNTIRDNMGGNGMYGSSIYSDALANSANLRSTALASNEAQVGAEVEKLKSAENMWLGDTAIKEADFENTWNLAQDQLNKGLIHDIVLADLGNDYALEQIDKQGQWGMNVTNANNAARESAAQSSGLGNIGGVLIGGLMDNWDSIF